ncbi:MAG TPA: hypothetical protein VHW47_05920 [Acidimicrobiales bacterium]|nr:hypothetical protein [Acidimicrobiales bacterium]
MQHRRTTMAVISATFLISAAGMVEMAGADAGAGAATTGPVTQCGPGISPNVLSAGRQLGPGGCLFDPSGSYELAMQTDGNLVVYFSYGGAASPLWDSGTEGNSGADAVVQTDGNLVVYSAAGTALWSSGTAGTPNPGLVMQGDGNAVVYGNSVGQQTSTGNQVTTSGSPYAAWSTGTQGLRGDALHPGQFLQPGQSLRSPNGQFGVTMGAAGALVLYDTGKGSGGYACPLWSVPSISAVGSGAVTFDFPLVGSSTVQMATWGDLALWRPGQVTGASEWDAGTSGSGNYAVVQTDGNFVVYSSSGTPLWSTETGNNSWADEGWVLCTGRTLQVGQSLYAVPRSSGYRLTMQSTCNLVLYNGTGQSEWQSNTDVLTTDNFTKSGHGSTLYDGPTPGDDYSGCYAVMGATDQLTIVAPHCLSCGYFPTFGVNGIWATDVNSSPKVGVPAGSFGPFVAFPSSSGTLKLENAAGVAYGTDPEPGTYKTKGEGLDIGKEIFKFAVMVVGAFI